MGTLYPARALQTKMPQAKKFKIVGFSSREPAARKHMEIYRHH
jgi:hypothetical protein